MIFECIHDGQPFTIEAEDLRGALRKVWDLIGDDPTMRYQVNDQDQRAIVTTRHPASCWAIRQTVSQQNI